MGVLHELGQALRTRRSEMGLTQAHFALLSGLSRQTINQIEAGLAPDLGLNKAERLASVVGLGLRVDGHDPLGERRGRMAPLVRAAATASVSYRTRMSGAVLKRILVTRQVPESYVAHIHALLDDAPVSLLAAVAAQLNSERSIDRDVVWGTYRDLAGEVKSMRDIWLCRSRSSQGRKHLGK